MRISSAIEEPRGGAAGRSGPRLRRDRKGGFTLMEVVLALAIIGLLAGLGLPFLRPGPGPAALRNKTFEIAALLRADRNAALRAGTESTVLVDAENRAVWSQTLRTRIVLPPAMSMRLLPQGLRAFLFYPDGSASGGRMSLTAGGREYVVDVNGLTAAVKTLATIP